LHADNNQAAGNITTAVQLLSIGTLFGWGKTTAY